MVKVILLAVNNRKAISRRLIIFVICLVNVVALCGYYLTGTISGSSPSSSPWRQQQDSTSSAPLPPNPPQTIPNYYNRPSLAPLPFISSEKSDYPIMAPSPDERVLIEALTKLVEKPFTKTADRYLDEAVSSYGSQHKLHRAFTKMFSSGLRLAVLGGSNTVPHYVRTDRGYVNLFCNWLDGPLREFGVTFTCENAAIGATGSNWFTACSSEVVDLAKTDILLVEFAINDFSFREAPEYVPHLNRPLEELIRMLLEARPHLHIVLIVMAPFGLLRPAQRKCEGNIFLRSSKEHAQLAQHYNLTSVQFMQLLCRGNNKTESTPEEQTRLQNIYYAECEHLSELGHRAVAEFLVHYFRRSLLELVKNLNTNNQQPESDRAMLEPITVPTVPAPLFSTTRLNFSAECFVSFKKQNFRLVDALIDFSSNLTKKKLDELDFSHDGLQAIVIGGDLTSFADFRLANFRPPTHPHCNRPRLTLAFKLRDTHSPGASVLATAKFVLRDGRQFDVNYKWPIAFTGYRVNYLTHLAPVGGNNQSVPEWFCSKEESTTTTATIDHIDLRIQKRAYPGWALAINAIIIFFECCQS